MSTPITQYLSRKLSEMREREPQSIWLSYPGLRLRVTPVVFDGDTGCFYLAKHKGNIWLVRYTKDGRYALRSSVADGDGCWGESIYLRSADILAQVAEIEEVTTQSAD